MADKKVFTMQAEKDLLASFKSCCEANDETQSQAVRAFMREYVAKNKQPDIFKQSKKGNK